MPTGQDDQSKDTGDKLIDTDEPGKVDTEAKTQANQSDAPKVSISGNTQGSKDLISVGYNQLELANVDNMPRSSEDRYDISVVKLGTEPYVSWKKHMMNVFTSKGLEEAIGSKTYGIANPAKESLAQAIITSSLDKTNRLNCIDCDSAYEIWQRLESLHEVKTSFETQNLFVKLNNYRMPSASNIAESIAEIRYLAAKLKTLGEPISDNNLMSVILRALPKSLRHIQLSWKTMGAADRNLKNLVSFILSEAADNVGKDNDHALLAKHKPKRFNRSFDSGANKDKDQALDGQMSHARQVKYRGFKSNNSNNSYRKREPQKTDQCNYCKKFGHWARDCYKKKNDDKNKPSNHGLQSTKRNWALMARRLEEINSEWIVDSGCSMHMTPNKSWLNDYEDFNNSNVMIELGNDDTIEAHGKGTIQTSIGDMLEVYYVPKITCNLYSIISAASQGHRAIFTQDEVAIYNNDVKVMTGYYTDGLYTVKLVVLLNEASSLKALKAATKETWHKRFGHISQGAIDKLLKRNAVDGLEITDREESTCEDCVLGKDKRKSHPTKTSDKATKPGISLHFDTVGPNQVKSLGNSYYYVLCKDEYSHYKMVCFVEAKTEIADKVKLMINIAESNTRNKVLEIHSDNGTEFLNKNLRNFLSARGINHILSPPYCPQANGFIEREIRTVTESARAILVESGLPEELWSEAVNTAVYVLNRTIPEGLDKTPFELWFNKRPNVKNLRKFGEDALVLLPEHQRRKFEPKAAQAQFVGYTNNQIAYRIYDSNTGRVIVTTDVTFPGENHLTARNANGDEQTPNNPEEDTNHLVIDKSEVRDEDTHEGDDYFEDRGDLHSSTTKLIPDEDHSSVTRHRGGTTSGASTKSTKPTGAQEDKGAQGAQRAGRPSSSSRTEVPRARISRLSMSNIIGEKLRSNPKQSTVFQARPTGSHHLKLAAVERELEPTSYSDALRRPDSDKWIEAMNAELESIEKNQVWELVDRPKNVNIVSNKWVYKIKRLPNGKIDKYKARLVARGFSQQFGIDYEETYAPVANMVTIRLLLANAAIENLFMRQFDVKTAFLNGDLEETVFMEQPDGLNNDPKKVCLLKKSLYGLKQAPRQWNIRFSTFLKQMRLVESENDHCVFYKRDPLVIIAIYVDDGIIFARDSRDIEHIIQILEREFDISRIDSNVYLGFEYTRDSKSITIHQRSYISKILKRFNMEDAKPFDNPSPVKQKSKDDLDFIGEEVPYREAVGSLMFASVIGRPDISHAVGKVSRKVSAPTKTDWHNVKRIFRYLNGKEGYGLTYSSVNHKGLEVYCDSDFAGDDETHRSTTGAIILFGGAPIYWKSQRQSLVTLSTTEAEAVAICSTVKDAMWIRKIAKELGIIDDAPTKVYCDNQSAIKITTNEKSVHRTRHMAVQTAYPRELCLQGEIEIEHVKSEDQIADVMTKTLTNKKFTHDIQQLMSIVRTVLPQRSRLMTLKCLLGLAIFLASIMVVNCANATATESIKYDIDFIYSNPCRMLEIVDGDLPEEQKQAGICARPSCDKLFENKWLTELENLIFAAKFSPSSTQCMDKMQDASKGITNSNLMTTKHHIASQIQSSITDDIRVAKLYSSSYTMTEMAKAGYEYLQYSRSDASPENIVPLSTYQYYSLVSKIMSRIILSTTDVRSISREISKSDNYGPKLFQLMNLTVPQGMQIKKAEICHLKRLTPMKLNFNFIITLERQQIEREIECVSHRPVNPPVNHLDSYFETIVIIHSMILLTLVLQVCINRQRRRAQTVSITSHSPVTYPTTCLLFCILLTAQANHLPEHYSFEHVKPMIYMPTDTIVESRMIFYNISFTFISPCANITSFVKPNDTMIASYKSLELECIHLYNTEWLPRLLELTKITPIYEDANISEEVERSRRSLENFSSGLEIVKEFYKIISNVVHTVYEVFNPYSMPNRVRNIEEMTQTSLNNFQRKFDVVHEVSRGLLDDLKKLDKTTREQRKQLEHLKQSLPKFTWISNYIQSKILGSIADLRTIANLFSRGKVATIEMGYLLNLTQLMKVDERDTYFDKITLINNQTIDFVFALREKATTTHVYEVTAFDYWTNLLTNPTRVKYQGPRFVVYNRTSRCIKPINHPTKRNIRESCRLRKVHDELKKWTTIARGDPFTSRYEPQVYTTQKYNYVYCFPGDLRIEYITRKCPATPFRVSTKKQMDVGEFFWVPEQRNASISQIKIADEKIHPEHFDIEPEDEEELLESYFRLKENLKSLKEANTRSVIINRSEATLWIVLTILTIILLLISAGAIVWLYYTQYNRVATTEPVTVEEPLQQVHTKRKSLERELSDDYSVYPFDERNPFRKHRTPDSYPIYESTSAFSRPSI